MIIFFITTTSLPFIYILYYVSFILQTSLHYYYLPKNSFSEAVCSFGGSSKLNLANFTKPNETKQDELNGNTSKLIDTKKKDISCEPSSLLNVDVPPAPPPPPACPVPPLCPPCPPPPPSKASFNPAKPPGAPCPPPPSSLNNNKLHFDLEALKIKCNEVYRLPSLPASPPLLTEQPQELVFDPINKKMNSQDFAAQEATKMFMKKQL